MLFRTFFRTLLSPYWQTRGDMGYDTLIMGIRDADAIRAALGIPDNEEIMSVIAVGKRGAEPTARPRKDLEEVVRFF